MNKREQWRYAAMWAGGMVLSVLFLQAEHGEKSRNFLRMLGEFLMKAALGIASFVVAAIGGWTGAPESLAYVMAIDYLTGLSVACFGKSKKSKSGRLSSAAGFRGLIKKGLIICVVVMAHLIDKGIGAGITTWRDVVCYCYMGNELLSILENFELLGIWIPPPLRKMLEVMRDKGIISKPPTEAETITNDKTKGNGIG